MKRILQFLVGLAALLTAATGLAQTSLTQTTLSAAVATTSINQFRVASITGITATSTVIFVDSEAMFVNAVAGATLTVTRGYNGTRSTPHLSGAMVLAGPPAA